jgi:hypothetical protein
MEAVHHIIFYIVRQLHKRLMKTNLMKLIYLVDLEYYKKMGKQATNFEYIYYKRGPWTSQFDKVLSDLEGFEIQSLRKEKVTSSGEYIIFNKGPKPRFEPSLPPDLLEIIDRFIYIFKEAPQKDLLQYVYSIEPMKSTRFGDLIDFTKVFPQLPVDSLIEAVVLEANREYEATNFPKILDSWVRENSELSIKNLAKREISLSDEILQDRENDQPTPLLS